MIRITDIQKGLRHLVGWEQNDITGGGQIQNSLTESESGLTFNQAHDLLTYDNIKAMLPDEGIPEAWDGSVNYKPGMKCQYENTSFICIKANTNHHPGTDFNDDYNEDFGDGYWRVYDQVSEFMRKATSDGIAKMANRIIEEKTINGSSKQLFERKTLFDVAGRISARIPKTHSLVGYMIRPLKGLGVTTQIHRIGLQMTGATGNVKVYIFHSSRKQPVDSVTLRVLDAKNYQWYAQDNLFLPYMGGEYRNDGGCWFIMYNENDIPAGMQAVNISRDWTREPCSGCNVGDVTTYRQMIKYIEVLPCRFSVPANFANNPELPDLDLIEKPQTLCYGMNLDLSIGCDLSDFIISQRSIFASVLQKEVAVNVLRRMLHNPNVKVNRNQMNSALQMDIEGNTMLKSPGLVGELNKSYKALDLDTERMDSACLACKKNGIKIKVC
jgi:hypothetical protein